MKPRLERLLPRALAGSRKPRGNYAAADRVGRLRCFYRDLDREIRSIDPTGGAERRHPEHGRLVQRFGGHFDGMPDAIGVLVGDSAGPEFGHCIHSLPDSPFVRLVEGRVLQRFVANRLVSASPAAGVLPMVAMRSTRFSSGDLV